MAIWRMRVACWVTEATNTHLEYVVIISFPLQQRLDERASLLRYTYIAVLFNYTYLLTYLLHGAQSFLRS